MDQYAPEQLTNVKIKILRMRKQARLIRRGPAASYLFERGHPISKMKGRLLAEEMGAQ